MTSIRAGAAAASGGPPAPGPAPPRPPPAAPERRAQISPDDRYRWALWRDWDPGLPRVAFVMLNPSTADAEQDDPTIRRCIGFARSWGYGSLAVANLFALRATDPKELYGQEWPIATGHDNPRWLESLTTGAQLVVAAWGVHRLAADQYQRMRPYLHGRLHCLDVTASGQPRHPLYLSAKLWPRPWAVTP